MTFNISAVGHGIKSALGSCSIRLDLSRLHPDALPRSGHPSDMVMSILASFRSGEMQIFKYPEVEMIKKALGKYNGKRKMAANELGISERTLYRKIKEYGIEM